MLNNTQVKNAKPKSNEYHLPDGLGLRLRIRPNGSKTWMFHFQNPVTKKREKMSFGAYPELTLA